jgi:hypothetical protein
MQFSFIWPLVNVYLRLQIIKSCVVLIDATRVGDTDTAPSRRRRKVSNQLQLYMYAKLHVLSSSEVRNYTRETRADYNGEKFLSLRICGFDHNLLCFEGYYSFISRKLDLF